MNTWQSLQALISLHPIKADATFLFLLPVLRWICWRSCVESRSRMKLRYEVVIFMIMSQFSRSVTIEKSDCYCTCKSKYCRLLKIFQNIFWFTYQLWEPRRVERATQEYCEEPLTDNERLLSNFKIAISDETKIQNYLRLNIHNRWRYDFMSSYHYTATGM